MMRNIPGLVQLVGLSGWRARQPQLDRPVARKLDPARRCREFEIGKLQLGLGKQLRGADLRKIGEAALIMRSA